VAVAEHIRLALERCAVPTLIFDLTRIEANARAFAAAARAHNVTSLFAVKACPNADVLDVMARHFDGFDVASPAEVVLVGMRARDRIVSVADPTLRASRPTPLASRRAMVDVDHPGQVTQLDEQVDVAVRISASITGRDPAIGAVLDGTGHRRSRFGVSSAEELRAIAQVSAGRRLGLHIHHGPVTATNAERFISTARAALAMAAEAELQPAFINLGGAWHGFADVEPVIAAIRAALGDLEIVVEPGRALTIGAGFATGRIVSGRSVGDRELRVSDLSRICHLRWSPIELVARAPHPGSGVKTLVVGPTCFEEDVLGEWTVEPDALAIGARIMLCDVSGYALGWNTSFGGVPPAEIVVE
jgi:diaminopimelate decarboxylase